MILLTFLDIDSWGIRFIEVSVLGWSRFKVGGRILVSIDFKEKTYRKGKHDDYISKSTLKIYITTIRNISTNCA